ncbi:MAG: CoA-disulfide reductase [Frankiales bacterium]|nr:CoA-disulfide reductase [Frankiales bacterium]
MHLVAVGGSDAGISAALRARELDPSVEVTVVVADAYPNFSICGIPYYISGEVGHWSNLAHRTHADLEATGMRLRLDTLVTGIDPAAKRLTLREKDGRQHLLDYDELVVGTGAVPVRPPIEGLDDLGPQDGVHLLHSMGDTFALTDSLERIQPQTALIVGAGYVGLEMAEGLTMRGIAVTQVEMLPEVLPTVDVELGALVHTELERHGVAVHTLSTVTRITRAADASAGRLRVDGIGPDDAALSWNVDLVLVVVGVNPDTDLLVNAGAKTGARGAVVVDETMATGLPHVWAAGDCVVTHHRQLGVTYLPLGTTAHKQGRVAGENALGGNARFAGSLGTQVVKVFDLVAARTGLREHEAIAAGLSPVSTTATPDDHKAYYPGAQPITIRVTGDAATGKLIGAQLIGARGTETAKRVDTYAAALFAGMTVEGMSELDLSYTPPLGSPWDAVQLAAQAWVRDHLLPAQQDRLPAAAAS